MQNIVKEKVKFLVTGSVNKTGSPPKMANTDARKPAIAATEDHVHATTEMNTIVKVMYVIMAKLFADLNGSFHILVNTVARRLVIFVNKN